MSETVCNICMFFRPTLASPKASENSYIAKMKASGRNIVVFYGSQTGTAEEFAGRLAKEAARYGMKALVADPEECEMVFEVVFPCLKALVPNACFFLCRRNWPSLVRFRTPWPCFAWPHTVRAILPTTLKLSTSGYNKAMRTWPESIMR